MTYKPTPCIPCGKKYVPTERPSDPFIRGEQMAFPKARLNGDGSIVYPMRGWEPPPPIAGYERDPGNPWSFRPIWPECRERQRQIINKQCGAIDIKMICKNGDCPRFHTDVTVLHCTECPQRKP